MTDREQLPQIQALLENARTILIMYAANPSKDELASAFALQQALRQAGKDATLYSPRQPQLQEMTQVAEITRIEVGNQNLVVSFDYSPEAVDKVSYHIGEETNKFYLTIKPQRGQEPLSTDSVEFSYTGAEADLIFLIGIYNLENLEQLYFGYEELFRNTPAVALTAMPATVGSINLSASTGVISELTAGLIKNLQLGVDPTAATFLLAGIEEATNGLQSPDVTADTFETVAFLMRSGAERQALPQEQPQPAQPAGQQPAPVKEYQIAGWQKADQTETEMKVMRQPSRQKQGQPVVPESRPNGPQKKKQGRKPKGGLNHSPGEISKK